MPPPLSLKARAIALLSQREHSRAELKRKLLAAEQRKQRRESNRSPWALDEQTLGVAHDAGDAGDATAPLALAAQLDTLLDELQAAGYLNEARYIESRLHQRSARLGTQRIQQELARQGLCLDAQQRAALQSSELERAAAVRLRRFGPELPLEAKEKARQMRFLLSRGFASSVVSGVLRGLAGPLSDAQDDAQE